MKRIPTFQNKKQKGCWNPFRSVCVLDRFDAILIIGILAYSLILSYISLYRYNSFELEYDLAIFHQSFWNTITGGGLLVNSLEGGSHFGVHFSPILLSLVPFYILAPGPQTLLIAQSILLSLGAIPIYLFGRNILGKESGCIMGLLFLIYPGIHGVNLYDFHEVAFLPFLLGMSLWAFLTGKKNYMLLFCLFSLLIKEDVCLIILMMGILGLYQTRKEPVSDRWHYIILIATSVGILVTYLMVIRPLFITSGSAMASGFLPQYMNVISNLSQFTGNRISYLLMIFLPLLFLPFGSPGIFAISIPSFLEILLSPSPYYYSIYYQYSALVIPVLFMASICTLGKIQRSTSPLKRRLFFPIICLLIISSIVCTAMYSPLTREITEKGQVNEDALVSHQKFLANIISVIPPEVSITTQMNLLPIVSKHKNIHENLSEKSGVVLIDTAFPGRSKLFTDNIQKIEESYTPVLHANYVHLYVLKNDTNLQSELQSSLKSVYF